MSFKNNNFRRLLSGGGDKEIRSSEIVQIQNKVTKCFDICPFETSPNHMSSFVYLKANCITYSNELLFIYLFLALDATKT